MAISKKERNEIINALRNLGGSTSLKQLAEALGRDVNGLSQTLYGKIFADLITQDLGRGGSRIIQLTEKGSSQGPLLDLLRQ